MSTRLAAPKHQPWVPLPYMRRAVDFLKSHYRGGLPLKPGGRKTSITLKAFDELRAEGKVRTMLVIAPLRVARQVWKQEGEKWTDFTHLNFALVTGDVKSRTKALKSGADVYLTNYENLQWLAKQYMGRPLPFDVVVFDELTKMKNARAVRHTAIRPRLVGVKYRWGLTGSLFAKGHMDIFGQQLILDDGAALGRYITHYRDTYFSVGFNGFDYDLIPGAERRIIEKLAPYWFYMDEKDYAQLPPLIDVPHIGDLEPKEKQLYERMKRDAIIQIGAQKITAANAGAVYSKLAQLANGAVYRDGHTTSDDFELLHNLKLDMLEELLDELDGEPLLLAYEFQHDMLRIQQRFGERFGGQVPYLGAGTTSRQEDQWVREWNERKLPLLAAHPQSAGHGLNMQEGQAYNVAHLSVTWDWELYDQFIRRVRRSGNDQTRIFNHLLIIRGTIDEEKLASVTDKDFTERRLLTALNNQILAEGAGTPTEWREPMVTKLSRPQGGEAQNGGGAPAGWGGGVHSSQRQPEPERAAPAREPERAAPAGWGNTTQEEHADQRERIRDTIAPQTDRAETARSAFTGGVGDKMAQVAGDYGDVGQDAEAQGGGAPAGWGGGTKAAPPPFDPSEQGADTQKATTTKRRTATKAAAPDVSLDAVMISARATVLAAVLNSSPDASVDDVLEISRDLMAFVEQG